MATIVNEVTGAIGLTGRLLGQILEYFGKLIAPTVHSVKDEVVVITGGGSGIGRYPSVWVGMFVFFCICALTRPGRRIMATIVNETVGAVILVGHVLWLLFKYFASMVVPTVHSVKAEVALITGGGNGIGRLVAIKLAERGATVVIWDLNEKMGAAVAEEINARGLPRAYSYQIDVTDRQRVYALADQVRREVGEVTMLINNAGIVTGKPFMDTPDELAIKTMEVNIMAHFWTTKAFLPSMIARDHGYLVTVASMAGYVGVPKMADYCASKHAAVGFDESIRNELKALKKHGVHTLCVCPNFIDTGMFEGVKTKYPLIFPILQPEWVANKIVYAIQTHKPTLLLPSSSYLATIMKGFLPTHAVDTIAEYFGLFESMDEFKGRAKQAALKSD